MSEKENIPSIKPEFEKINEHFNTDVKDDGKKIYIKDEEGNVTTVVQMSKTYMDFDQGKMIADVHIDTQNTLINMKVDEIFVTNWMIGFEGYNDREGVEIFPY